jgi:8-amino-7-oxononanoate synthase
MDAERQHLLALSGRLRAALALHGLNTAGSTTQIVPVLAGEESRALEAMRALESEGILAVAVRPPTVPPGGSRLRLSLTAAHTEADVDRLADAVVRALEAPA